MIDIPCHQGFGVTVAFNKQEGVTTMNDLSQALSQALSQVQSCRELLDFQNVEPNLYQALYQVLSQNWDKPTLTSIIQILKETIEDCSMKQLLKTVREKNRMRLMNLYIKPLMVVGLIEMIHPEVPKHPKQKYKLSDKGRVFLLKIFKRI